MCALETVYMCLRVFVRVYSNTTSKTYPLSRIPAFTGINEANVSAGVACAQQS